MSNATAEVLETEVSEPVRVIPKITPKCVRAQHQVGLCWRDFKVVLPEGIVRQDLHDHQDIWRPVQLDRNSALIADDHLFIVASDRFWAGNFVVINAGSKSVELNPGNMLWSGDKYRQGIVWQDENYEVEWAGFGYSIFQRAKGNRERASLETGFLTPELAKAAVHKKYARAM